MIYIIDVQSQSFDSLLLKEVEITATSLKNENTGTNVSVIDVCSVANSTVSELFSLLGFMPLRNNGNNSYAIGSMRGGSSNHTLLMWNGMPINNPMLGLSDLSLIPIGGLSQIKINKGSSSSICGNGSIAGSVNLENVNKNDSLNSISGGIKVASFSNLSSFGSLTLSKKKIQLRIRHDFSKGVNNFPFQIDGIDSTFYTSNSNVKLVNTNLDLTYFHSKNSSLTFLMWNIFANRQIPANINQKKSEAYQIDRAKRGMLRYKINLKKSSVSINGGIVNESNIYIDKPVRINDTNQFQSYYFDVYGEKNINENFKLLISVFNNYTTANSDNYVNKIFENRSALLLSTYFSLPNFDFQVSNRTEKNQNTYQSLIPAFGMESKLLKDLIFKLKINKNYRYPGLNDQYWRIGGNPLLKPENGWSQEASINKTFGRNKVGITLFKRIINEMILWVPQTNNGIFSPINIAKVNTKGAEVSIKNEYRSNDFLVSSDFTYEYVKSINEVEVKLPKIERGSQLWYIPEHSLNFNMAFKYKKHRLSYYYNYNSVKSGIQKKLAAFGISSIFLESEIDFKKNTFKAYLQIENVTNNQYYLIENRPMPGINFKLGFEAAINFKKYKKYI